jgi:hypothetical protein
MNYSKYIRNTCLAVLILMQSIVLSAQGIHISGGCRFIMSGSVKMVLQDASFNNEGFFTPGTGTLKLTGAQEAFISSNTTLNLQHVTISKSPGSIVHLRQDATVNGVLDMIAGNLLLGDRTLYLGNTANISGESNQSYITGGGEGRIFVSRTVSNPPAEFNPGNIGLALTSPSAPGLMVIERRHTSMTFPNEVTTIQRNFNIVAMNSLPAGSSLRFFYLDAELNGQNENELVFYTISEENGWVPLGKDGNNSTNNWVLKTGVQQWGQFTLAPQGFPSMITKPSQQIKEGTDRVRIYPNPSHDVFIMEFTGRKEKNMVLKLHDQAGRVLQQKNVQCRVGINIISWNISTYASGMYYISSDNAEIKNLQILRK